MKNHNKENRKHTRISLQFEAELQVYDNPACSGTTMNISFGGVYFKCENAKDILKNGKGTFKLILDPQSEESIINFRCQVVRRDSSGAALKFSGIDIVGYNKFKNLMIYNSEEPDKLLAELNNNPGLTIDNN